MEKIRLKNGTEFEVVPMGVDRLGDCRRFKILSTLGYAETLHQFMNVENIETIDYILADGTVNTTYMDCVGFKNINYTQSVNEEDNTIQDVYIVELSVNAVERLLRSMQVKIDTLVKENAELKEEKLLSELDTDYRLSILELGL